MSLYLVTFQEIKMAFEPEITLFQASFCCPENGLQEHQQHDEYNSTEAGGRQQGRVNVSAVCHAIGEIVCGLEGDRTEDEKHHWNFKLHAILFCKLLEGRRKETEQNAADEKSCCEDCLLEYFEGVSRALPSVDLGLYLDVANTLEWGRLCAQVFCSLDYKLAEEIMEEISAECIKTDRLNLLVSILSGLLLSSYERGNISGRKRREIDDRNIHLRTRSKPRDAFESPATFHRHVVSSCKQICNLKSKIENRNLRFDVIRALATCLDNLASELQVGDGNGDAALHSDNSNRWEGISSVARAEKHERNDPNVSGAIFKLHLLSLSDSRNCCEILDQCDDTLVSQESRRNRDVDYASPRENCELLRVLSTKVVDTLHRLLTVDWADFCVDRRGTNTADPQNFNLSQDKEVNKCVHLARDVCKTLNRLIQHFGQNVHISFAEQTLIDIDLMKQQCSEVEAHLSQVLGDDVLLAEKFTVAMRMDKTTNEQREHMWLLEAIRRVDERLEGYEDDLSQLLSATDQWEDGSWMECLERNITALALPRFMEKLISVAMAMDKRKLGDDVIQRVLRVFLAGYSSLPFPLQNKLRDNLWSYPKGVSVFARHEVENFDRESTSAFNRLVSLARGQENTEVWTAVSRLALQCPVRTLRLAVGRAVSNPAVCQAVCQVLQAMPSLATFQQRDCEWPLLCRMIRDAMATLATTPSDKANLLQLVTALLQPFKPFLDLHCPFWMPSVLSAEAFTKVCILPNLYIDATAIDNRNHFIMVLKFLKAVVDLHETRNSDAFVLWTSVFPIMLCLCQLLDSCQVLWGGVAMPILKAEVKEAVQGLLGKIGRIAMVMPDNAERERGISWLINRVMAKLHWSTSLQLLESLPGCSQLQKRLVPESVINICSLPDSEWSATPFNRSNNDTLSLCEQITELLLCWRVSYSLANILGKSIVLPEGTSNDDFLEALTLALVQVLPQSTMGEWQCIVGLLAQLLTSKVLWVPCSVRYVMELPMVNIGDFRVQLGQSQLLLSVMQLLMSPCCQDWATPPLLHHVTRCYVGTMQEILSQTSDLSGQPGCLFVIGQFFCHACDVIGSLPTDELKEQVFVLTLELLSQMVEMRVGFEWTNQIEVLELLANQKLDGERRKTLLQKISSLRSFDQSQ